MNHCEYIQRQDAYRARHRDGEPVEERVRIVVEYLGRNDVSGRRFEAVTNVVTRDLGMSLTDPLFVSALQSHPRIEWKPAPTAAASGSEGWIRYRPVLDGIHDVDDLVNHVRATPAGILRSDAHDAYSGARADVAAALDRRTLLVVRMDGTQTKTKNKTGARGGGVGVVVDTDVDVWATSERLYVLDDDDERDPNGPLIHRAPLPEAIQAVWHESADAAAEERRRRDDADAETQEQLQARLRYERSLTHPADGDKKKRPPRKRKVVTDAYEYLAKDATYAFIFK